MHGLALAVQYRQNPPTIPSVGRKNKASLIAGRQGMAEQVVFESVAESKETTKRVASVDQPNQAQFLASRFHICFWQVTIKMGPQCLRLCEVKVAALLYTLGNTLAHFGVTQGVQQRPENSFKKHER